jgi:hypothetical protein
MVDEVTGLRMLLHAAEQRAALAERKGDTALSSAPQPEPTQEPPHADPTH